MRIRARISVLIVFLSWPTVLVSQEESRDFLDDFIIKTPGQFNG